MYARLRCFQRYEKTCMVNSIHAKYIFMVKIIINFHNKLCLFMQNYITLKKKQ